MSALGNSLSLRPVTVTKRGAHVPPPKSPGKFDSHTINVFTFINIVYRICSFVPTCFFVTNNSSCFFVLPPKMKAVLSSVEVVSSDLTVDRNNRNTTL